MNKVSAGKIIGKINRLSLPAVIIIASLILGGFYYAGESGRQKQDKREYVSKRKMECYNIEQKERENWNNVAGSGYSEDKDACFVRYKKDYKGINCDEEYKDTPTLQSQCKLSIFTKEF
ncbi:MAG: hypothetical protein UV68_C0041G0016 [Candidatus Collierbacteria bacterium GW2011_GWC2_43_12]|uniref:Uncharacterized protein n=1 Tax=Candidatus Collierbacteria bacterium GW2011_GWC2_43_12 TaxID=1618390 RepID=A0A0G1D4J8_9BACT|nr:MAG: hypothetical protein UV68_C0041G0016 [Candidatus Collierbacteria bacterium GW2011_GWC2_43_12]